MTDDTIIRPRFGCKPREEATCTHEVGHDEELRRRVLKRSDNLRNPRHLPADLVDSDTLGRVGLDPDRWPGMAGRPARQVADRELKELRQRADSLVEAAASLEIACRLVRTEAETIARRLGERLGDDGPPKGAA